jgi:PPM family protein phosphatase
VIQTALLSLQGLRASNQDRILLVHEPGSDRIIAGVADGLGGMFAGDKAAEIAVETLREWAEPLYSAMESGFNHVSDSLMQAYQVANDRIRSFSNSQGKPNEAGTTLTVWIAAGSHSLTANIGDTRCYSIRKTVRQITRDHSVADELMSQGILSPKEFASSPLRHQLTQSLGTKVYVDPDIFPAEQFDEIVPGQTILLCSDGFYAMLEDADFHQLETVSDLDSELRRLADQSLDRGSTDNISALVIRTNVKQG